MGRIIAFLVNKISVLLLAVLVLSILPLVALANVIQGPETPKSILAEADVYSTITGNALDIRTAYDSSSDKNESVSDAMRRNGALDPDKLTLAIEASLSPEHLQSQTETAIDDAYSYLDGSTDTLSLNFTHAERSDIISSELRSFAEDAFQDLPACAQSQAFEFDPLVSGCLPPESELQKEIDRFVDGYTQSLLSWELKNDNLNRWITESDAQNIRSIYGLTKRASAIFWGLFAVLLVLGVVTSHKSRRGLKIIGGLLIINSLLVIAGSLILRIVPDIARLGLPSGSGMTSTQSEAIENIISPLLRSVVSRVTNETLIMAAMILVIGVAALFIGKIFDTGSRSKD